ncbi:MAG: lipase [Pseudomonadota bacterium]
MNKVLVFVSSVALAACDVSSIGIDTPATGMPPATAPSAPSDSGPALTADPAALAASLVCTGDLASQPPALLVHGTAVSAEANFSWNYVPALSTLGYAVCTVQMPNNGMSDIQDSAEYIVHALREMNRVSGRKIQVLGHSQGGMIPRWALRFWPDTRALVDDLIGFASSNHGTVDSIAFCEAPGGCAESFWQQTLGSNFITALNADFETFDEISYTSIYTYLDEIVVPNLPLTADTQSSALAGGANVTNVATQDVCPNNLGEHLALGTYDAVAYAIALDALTHAGPADPARVPLTVCLEPFMPGVDPTTFITDYAAAGMVLGQTVANAVRVPEEPPLKCYVDNSCQP